jgi:hypothetical protein
MTEDLFDPPAQEAREPVAPIPSAARHAADSAPANVDDLFDFAPLTVREEPLHENAEAASSVAGPAAALPADAPPTVQKGARRRSLAWIWITAATIVNLAIAGVVLVNVDSKTSRLLERLEKERSPGAGAAHTAVSPGTAPVAEPVSGPVVKHNEVDPHPALPRVVNTTPVANRALGEAEALFRKGRYAEARKKFFEVLLAPALGLDGKDAASAKLGIARCLAREGLAPGEPRQAPAGEHR